MSDLKSESEIGDVVSGPEVRNYRFYLWERESMTSLRVTLVTRGFLGILGVDLSVRAEEYMCIWSL